MWVQLRVFENLTCACANHLITCNNAEEKKKECDSSLMVLCFVPRPAGATYFSIVYQIEALTSPPRAIPRTFEFLARKLLKCSIITCLTNDRKSNRSIAINRWQLINCYRFLLANRWPIDNHKLESSNCYRLPSIFFYLYLLNFFIIPSRSLREFPSFPGDGWPNSPLHLRKGNTFSQCEKAVFCFNPPRIRNLFFWIHLTLFPPSPPWFSNPRIISAARIMKSKLTIKLHPL